MFTLLDTCISWNQYRQIYNYNFIRISIFYNAKLLKYFTEKLCSQFYQNIGLSCNYCVAYLFSINININRCHVINQCLRIKLHCVQTKIVISYTYVAIDNITNLDIIHNFVGLCTLKYIITIIDMHVSYSWMSNICLRHTFWLSITIRFV